MAFAVLYISTCITANAQQSNLRTAYFLDGYTYRYKFNPSFAPERSFIAIPSIGNISVGAESNLGLSNFFFPTDDGELSVFFDNAISEEQFMKGIKNRNLLNINANVDVLAFGFRTGKSYHTVDISVKLNERAHLPKSLFQFAKFGTSGGNTSATISNIGLRTDIYTEIAYGYSRSIGEDLRVGGRVKILRGLAREDIMIEELSLNAGRDIWDAKAEAYAEISGPVAVGTIEGSDLVDYQDITVPEKFNEIASGMNSYGFALDLGASYDFLDYFTASLSLLDVGFISWNNTTTAVSSNNSWKFDGFGTIKTDGTTDFGSQLSGFGEELLNMTQLEKAKDRQKTAKGLTATIHAGIEAKMPFYQRLAFGLLGYNCQKRLVKPV